MVEIRIAWTDAADRNLGLPSYLTAGAAGADLRANLPPDARAAGLTLAPGAREAVPTGLRMAIPPGHELQVRPRSGLALRHGLTLLNAPGTVDADYRGEVRVILINHGAEPVRIGHGDRIAQAVLAPVLRASWIETDSLGETPRGAGGFGSTGR